MAEGDDRLPDKHRSAPPARPPAACAQPMTRPETSSMKTRTRFALAATAMLATAPAFALNGFFAHGYGTQSKAMAGAGVALALDSLAPATNPAAIVFLGRRRDVGLSLFNPVRGHRAVGEPTGACANAQQCTFGLGPQDLDSGLELFPIPHFGLAQPLSDRAAFAFSVYGNGGLNTDYDSGRATFGVPAGTVPPGQSVTAPGVFGGNDTGIDLSQLFMVLSYARRVGGDGAWGIAPILAGQRFRAKGFRTFGGFSRDADALSNNGYDHALGGGLRAGVQWALTPGVRVGGSWQSRIHMTEFDRYAGLFAQQGDLDIPSTFTVGVAVKPTAALTVAFDVQQIRYSEVNSIGNPLLPNLMQARLGDDRGPGFGWNDQTIYKLGLAFKGGHGRTWRLGYSHGDQQVPDSQVFFNVVAPAVVAHHITGGLTQKLDGGREWNLSLMFAPRTSVSGSNALDPAQRIEIEARMFEIELSYGWGG
jgi:long-chain fatty acid transport protein